MEVGFFTDRDLIFLFVCFSEFELGFVRRHDNRMNSVAQFL